MPGLRCVGEGPSAVYWTPPGGWRVFFQSLIRDYRYSGLDWWRYQNSHGVLAIQGVPPGKQSLRLKTRWNPFKPQRYRFCPLRASLLTLPIIRKRVSVTPRTGTLIGKRNNVKIVASSVVSWELVVPPRPVPLTKNWRIMLVWFTSWSIHPPLCHHPFMWYPYIHLGGAIWMTIMVFISCVQRMLSPFCQYEEYFLSPIPRNVYNILPFIVSRCECCFFFRGEGGRMYFPTEGRHINCFLLFS